MNQTSGTTDYLAIGQSPTWGTITGSFTETHYNDGNFQTITETTSGGKPSRRFSRARFDWNFDVQPALQMTLYANVWGESSGDNDQFQFSYSTDASNFLPMFSVSALADQGYTSFALPANLTGPLTIRVEDTDHERGNQELNSLFVDHLYIQAVNSSGGTIPAAPDNLLILSVSSNSISLQWQDHAEDELGFYLERSNDLSNWTRVATLSADSTQTIDTGLNENQLYHYRLQAYNSNGESNYSNTISRNNRHEQQ